MSVKASYLRRSAGRAWSQLNIDLTVAKCADSFFIALGGSVSLTTLGFFTSSGLYHLDALSDFAGTFRSPPANFFVWACRMCQSQSRLRRSIFANLACHCISRIVPGDSSTSDTSFRKVIVAVDEIDDGSRLNRGLCEVLRLAKAPVGNTICRWSLPFLGSEHLARVPFLCLRLQNTIVRSFQSTYKT